MGTSARRRRGPAVGLAGAAVSAAALLAAFAAVPGAGTAGGALPQEFLEEVFDEVAGPEPMAPGASRTFAYDAGGEPLLWGLQVEGHRRGDSVAVRAGGAAVAEHGGPLLLDVLVPDAPGPVEFEVENTGPREVSVVVMFGAGQQGRDVLSGDGRGVPPALAAVAAAGAALAVGACAMVAGAVLAVADRAGRGPPR